MKFEVDLPEPQVQQLRELIDAAPLWSRGGRPGYIELVAKLLPQLPLESTAVPSSGGDSSPSAFPTNQAGGGFQLVALTKRGEEALPQLLRQLEGLS